MCSAHDNVVASNRGWMPVAGAAALILTIGLAGCKNKSREFADIVEEQQNQQLEATLAAEPAQATPDVPLVETPAPETPLVVAEPAPVPTQPAQIDADVQTPPTVLEAPVVVAEPPVRPPLVQITTRPGTVPLALTAAGQLRREWPLAVAYRPSGDVLAGPVYYPTVDQAPARPDWQSALLDAPEFVLNTVLLPVRAVITPPWAKLVYSPVNPAGFEVSEPILVAPAYLK